MLIDGQTHFWTSVFQRPKGWWVAVRAQEQVVVEREDCLVGE